MLEPPLDDSSIDFKTQNAMYPAVSNDVVGGDHNSIFSYQVKT